MESRWLAMGYLIAALALGGCSGPTSDQPDNSGVPSTPASTCPSAASVADAIDAAVDPGHPPSGAKGLVVAYLGPDDVPVYKSYGIAVQGGGVPLDENTLFGIGSITKTFTATLLGVAAVHTPALLTTPVPVPSGFNNIRPNVTYTDLADHHAGLPKNCARNLNTLNDLWAEYTADPIQCDPSNPVGIHDCGCCTPEYQKLLGGTVPSACDTNLASVSCPAHARTTGASGFVYSNEGFEILGHSLASNLGFATWKAANQTLITQPLGMTDTVMRENFTPDQDSRAADGCSKNGPNTYCQLLNWLPIGNPAAGLFSTASDMVKFLRYNMTPPPTSCDPASDARCDLFSALPIVHRTYESAPGGDIQLAWQVVTKNCGSGDVTITSKDGDNGPFQSWIGYTKDRKGVLLLSNAPVYDLAAIGEKILLSAP